MNLHESAQPCGCDKGANHLCAWHSALTQDKPKPACLGFEVLVEMENESYTPEAIRLRLTDSLSGIEGITHVTCEFQGASSWKSAK